MENNIINVLCHEHPDIIFKVCMTNLEDYNALKIILELGADPNTHFEYKLDDNFNTTPLALATYNNDIQIIDLLLKYNADVNYNKNWPNYNCLTIACQYNYTKLALLFISLGAKNREYKNFAGTFSALKYAIENNMTEVIQKLQN